MVDRLAWPTVDREELIKQNLKETVDFFGRVVYEPYDWARVGLDCLNEDCTGWDFLGLLPLLPAGITKYGDEIGGLLSAPARINYPWHHLLPRRFRAEFANIGANDIDDYLVSVPVEVHTSLIHGGGPRGGAWNAAWDEWLRTYPNASATDVFKQVGKLIHDFGLDGIIRMDLVK